MTPRWNTSDEATRSLNAGPAQPREVGVLDRQLDELEKVVAHLFQQNDRLQSDLNRLVNPRPAAVQGDEAKMPNPITRTVESRLNMLHGSLMQLHEELRIRADDLEKAV